MLNIPLSANFYVVLIIIISSNPPQSQLSLPSHHNSSLQLLLLLLRQFLLNRLLVPHIPKRTTHSPILSILLLPWFPSLGRRSRAALPCENCVWDVNYSWNWRAGLDERDDLEEGWGVRRVGVV